MAHDFGKQIAQLLAPVMKRDKLYIEYNSVPEAKQKIGELRLLQKELRAVKKEIALTKKQIAAEYAAKDSKVGHGALDLLAGRNKWAAAAHRSDHNNIHAQRDKALAPYDAWATQIDHLLLSLDNIKLQIETWIAQQK